jgi:bifunctional non-homologous end joining protein LigD
VPLPGFQPLTLRRRPQPFSHPDWIFELKWDGFRSLARVENGRCRLLSRNANEFRSFAVLNEWIPKELGATTAVLDGEIVCLDEHGKPHFRDLLFRSGEPRFVAFDVLFCNGENLRYVPLAERKFRLRSIVPHDGERLLYCDHVEEHGETLFAFACDQDLEGIVAKRKFDPYIPDHAQWLKIRNRAYSQWIGREELFERERESNPDLKLWDGCTLACAQ